MLLLSILPTLTALVGGTVLWVLVALRPSRLEALGLGRGREPEPRDARLAALVVFVFFPLQVVVLSALGVTQASPPVLKVQATVVTGLLTVAVFAAGYVAIRARRRNVCVVCDADGPESICPVCGGERLPDPAPPSRAETFGFLWQPLTSLKTGLVGVLLAYPLVTLAMWISLPFRSEEKVHPFLKSLIENRTGELVFWVFLAAAVVAPVVEELVFRAGLQGWLRNRLQPWTAIAITSVLFATIHGWPDMIGILPLAFVLGFVYERTNDYLAVVVTHGVFNALMTWNTIVLSKALEELEKAKAAAEAMLI